MSEFDDGIEPLLVHCRREMVSDSVTKWLATKVMTYCWKQYGTTVKAQWNFCPLTDFVGNLLIKFLHIEER
jgi:hypothetical protein